MLVAIVIVSFIFAIWHYVYEGSILPAIRVWFRYKMFALRDKLRNLKEEKGDQIDDELFDFIDSSISTRINLLPYLNLYVAHRISKAMEHSVELNKEMKSRAQAISKSTEITQIDEEMQKYHVLAIFANSGGWLLFLLPLIVVLVITALVFGFYKVCKDGLRKKVRPVVLASEMQFKRAVVLQEKRVAEFA